MDGQQRWVIRLVSGVWALNLVAGMVPALKFEPSEAVNGIFMAIVGGLFVAGKAQKRDGAEAHDEEKK